MESSVMTSASSHRLRSAVSACAQPTHSYLSSSYLGTSIQCESHDSGDCFKKFNSSGRNGETTFLEKLNIRKKPESATADYSIPYKRQKSTSKSSLNHCFGSKSQHRPKNNINESASGVLNIIPKHYMIGNDFLSKLKLNRNLIDSKRLSNYLGGTNDTAVNTREKVISIKGSNNNYSASNNYNYNTNKNDKDIKGSCNNSSSKVLNNRNNNCNKSKIKNNQKSPEITIFGKKNCTSKESEHSDECPKCGDVHLDEGIRSEKQDISKWQPKHAVTRRTAQIVREIKSAWLRRLGYSKAVPAENIQRLFNDLKLYPTASQVIKMLKCTRECPENPSTNIVTYYEFCKIASSLLKFRKTNEVPPPPPQSSSVIEKNVARRNRKLSKGMSKYEVFLGGSCNPTTWRTDEAIPELQNMGISYYNPQQVEEWKPELLEVEYHAKENATVMFFVIDNQTRGVSALIEVAHLAGQQRKLILVIQSYTQKNQIICGEEISQKEYEDLKSGQEVLQNLVERQGISVFDNIKVALKQTEKILRGNLSVQDFQESVHVERKENSLDPHEVFEKLNPENSGEMGLNDVCLALKMLTGREISFGDLKKFISNSGIKFNGTHLDDVKFDFQNFSQLVTEIKTKEEAVFVNSFPLNNLFGVIRDVYLGGTVENTSWRESVAIPLLKSQNLTYFLPTKSQGTMQFTEAEAIAIEHSFILLFVITSTARSIAAMALAGHYIGKGAKVVLCVQHLPEGVEIDDEKLSECAVKDYNRGRMYLMDIAKRNYVPVFDEIPKVMEYAINVCKGKSSPKN